MVTTYRGNEEEACSELWYLLGQVGDATPIIERTNVSGLIVAKTSLNPFEVIERFRRILQERPYEFRYLLRVIPIERVVRTDIDEISRVAHEFENRIGENETFRVTVEKRFTETSTRSIIEAIASKINRKVDLEKPDKIVLVEVIGGLTGMSLIKPEDVLSVTKEKAL
ncbi:MAG: THUMP domain-containing protein [Candidatus Bathyarchaeia archaeon]|nr:THUMP domain-containing protein [Candidatus Bathyarchaeota archaeon]